MSIVIVSIVMHTASLVGLQWEDGAGGRHVTKRRIC